MINIFLGGERSILLSYRDIYSIFGLFPGFLELQPVLRRLRRAVLLIKKRSIFDRFISSFRVIDPSAIVRREVGTVASGAISQDDLNSQQNYCFSADSCSPFFLGGGRSILLSYRDISAVPHINGTAFYYYIHFILFRQGELLYSSMKLILP